VKLSQATTPAWSPGEIYVHIEQNAALRRHPFTLNIWGLFDCPRFMVSTGQGV
jgi:hypothetical protein